MYINEKAAYEVNKYVQKLLQQIYDEEIIIYQIHYGSMISRLEEEARKNLSLTGGELYIVDEVSAFNRRLTSVITEISLGRTDTLDSDGDGLFDCRELCGIVMPDGTILKMNPYSEPNSDGIFDEDGDGLSDKWELGYNDDETDLDYWKNRINVSQPSKVKGFSRTLLENTSLEMELFEPLEMTRNNAFVMYVNTRSNPFKRDSDGDGYLDNGRNNDGIFPDPRPLKNDVQIYEIKKADKYVPILDEDNELVYYGGNQSWFGHVGMKEFGCGVVAAENYMLYLAMEDKKYLSNLLDDNFKRLDEELITKTEFVRFGDKLFDIREIGYFPPTLIGLQPKTLKNGLNGYFLEYKLPFKASWEITPVFRRNVFDYDDEIFEFERKIKKQLGNNLPVIFEIGITSSDVYFYEKKAKIDKANGALFQFDYKMNDSEKDSVSRHYMTIDKFIVDEVVNEKWVQVNTWGGERYINFEEWINGESGLCFYGGILIVGDKE